MESGSESFIVTKNKIKKCLSKNYTYRLTHDVSLDVPLSQETSSSEKFYPRLDKFGHLHHGLAVPASDSLSSGDDMRESSCVASEPVCASVCDHMEGIYNSETCSSEPPSAVKRRKRSVNRKLPTLPLPRKGNIHGLSLAEELNGCYSRNNCPSKSPSPETVPGSSQQVEKSGLSVGSLFEHLDELDSDEQTPDVIDRHLSDTLYGSQMNFNATSRSHPAFLSSNNPYLQQDSSPQEQPMKRVDTRDSVRTSGYLTESSSSNTINEDVNLCPTHRGAHRFIPRHEDEVAIEIGDPIFVDVEGDDLWCEGMNLRTGQHGIFPAVYATDLKILHEDAIVEDGGKLKPAIFVLRFLGSIEVSQHRGTDVLVQAMNKVVLTRRMTLNTAPAPLCTVEVNELGIKMIDRTKVPKVKSESDTAKTGKIAQRLRKILALTKNGQTCCNHFFSLKNVSFCGSHPKNPKYFGFITKHPTEMRFAAHVFLGEQSTKNVGEAVGYAFQRFYAEYLAFQHPTEDIYLE